MNLSPFSVGGLSLVIVVGGLVGCGGGPRPAPSFPEGAGYPIGYVERGMASWYGPGFHGNRTANGERYDMHELTAAHRTLPLGSVAQVRSLTNGRSVTVRINDRGPFVKNRIIDLSYRAARELGMLGEGTGRVEVAVVGYQGLPGAMGALKVQLASFADRANAQALVGRLSRSYPDARIVAVELSEGRRYRVQIGPFDTERQAEAAARNVDAQFGFEGLVVRDDQ